jgi:hypothetical protein
VTKNALSYAHVCICTLAAQQRCRRHGSCRSTSSLRYFTTTSLYLATGTSTMPPPTGHASSGTLGRIERCATCRSRRIKVRASSVTGTSYRTTNPRLTYCSAIPSSRTVDNVARRAVHVPGHRHITDLLSSSTRTFLLEDSLEGLQQDSIQFQDHPRPHWRQCRVNISPPTSRRGLGP